MNQSPFDGLPDYVQTVAFPEPDGFFRVCHRLNGHISISPKTDARSAFAAVELIRQEANLPGEAAMVHLPKSYLNSSNADARKLKNWAKPYLATQQQKGEKP